MIRIIFFLFFVSVGFLYVHLVESQINLVYSGFSDISSKVKNNDKRLDHIERKLDENPFLREEIKQLRKSLSQIGIN